MRRKSALITGVAGMDGSHLAEFLLEKDYHVYGIIRRNATRNLENAAHLENDIDIIEGDITDMSSMLRIIQSCRPHELYNLAAQSHVHTSFEQPLASMDITANGIVNILESVKALGYSTKKFNGEEVVSIGTLSVMDCGPWEYLTINCDNPNDLYSSDSLYEYVSEIKTLFGDESVVTVSLDG